MDTSIILDAAKETMLEHGEYIPTLYIEYNTNEIDLCVLLDGSEDTLDKQKYLFSLGRERGLDHRHEQVTQVCLVTEAWISHVKKGEKRKYERPRDDPNRKEVLLVQILDCIPPNIKQSCVVVEIIKDNEGKVRDLFQDNDPIDEVHSSLLMAFLAGALSAKMKDEELKKLIDKTMRKLF